MRGRLEGRRVWLVLQAHQIEWFARQKKLKLDPNAYLKAAKPDKGPGSVVSMMAKAQKSGMRVTVKRRPKPKGEKGQ